MTRRRLPIGIQTFQTIREDNCYYVDKTAYAWRLANEGTHYFLSRPRRFGKSLFLDTLKELFEGNEPLFRGLDVHDRWDWSARHPVLRLSFGSGNFKESGYVHKNLMAQLDAIERRAGVDSAYDTAPERFGHLIEALHESAGRRVAVLVDEYDKPILDALEAPEVARANRDYLRGLYATIKDSDSHVRFTFLTGVSKFSKVSLFSGLNNLQDITLDPRYSAICGYTDPDLDEVFAPELPGLKRDEIRDWYNGYQPVVKVADPAWPRRGRVSYTERHGNGQETGGATGVAAVGDDGGAADERGAPILRASQPGSGSGRVRRFRRGVVRGVLRGADGPAESASWAVFPDAVHRLFRGPVVGARDCVAGGRFSEPAVVPGLGCDRAVSGSLDRCRGRVG